VQMLLDYLPVKEVVKKMEELVKVSITGQKF
jgi:hypothetical protein